MKLQKLFEHLTLGELKQLGIGGYEEYKAIQEKDYPEIVSHLNLGLINLYTRFPMLEKELLRFWPAVVAFVPMALIF